MGNSYQTISMTDPRNDKAALYMHFCKTFPQNIPKILDLFEVTFLQQSDARKLDFFERRWVSNLHAEINICKTYLNKVTGNHSFVFAG